MIRLVSKDTKPDAIERAVDEVQLILKDYLSDVDAYKATGEIIPVIGVLIRTVMRDTADAITQTLMVTEGDMTGNPPDSRQMDDET